MTRKPGALERSEEAHLEKALEGILGCSPHGIRQKKAHLESALGCSRYGMRQKEAHLEKALEGILGCSPYGVPQEEKDAAFGEVMEMLTGYHQARCEGYGRILYVLKKGQGQKIEACPMIPVTLFKEYELMSIPQAEVFKVLRSSGTTAQKASKIVLDERTAALQQQVLAKIVQDFIGKKRMPMLVMDTPKVLKNREMFTARGAGILGFAIFSSEICFGLKEDMSLDLTGIRTFLEKQRGRGILVFGFTHMVWQYLCQPLKERGLRLDLSNGFLIHGGGWKKLQEQAVSEERFREELKRRCGICRVSNYYGMAEQTGTIYMECEEGRLHVSSYSEVIIRDPGDFSVCRTGEEGLVQVLSPIALSYPGHSLLTEDKGVLLGIDDCPCGRKGKYFKITGRLRQAEIRGCSNV